MHYLALGDSISIDDYTGVAGGGAVSQFARLIGADQIENLTSDGQRTDGVIAGLAHVVRAPNVITLTAGGNDFLLGCFLYVSNGQHYTLEQWREITKEPLDNLRQIAKSLARFECPVIINTVYDPTDGDDTLSQELGIPAEARCAFDALNAGIRGIADTYGFLLADLEVLFEGHGLNSKETWLVKQIEPNYAGATAIAQHWHKLFREQEK